MPGCWDRARGHSAGRAAQLASAPTAAAAPPLHAPQIASLDEQSDMVLTAPTISDGIRILGKALHGCYW